MTKSDASVPQCQPLCHQPLTAVDHQGSRAQRAPENLAKNLGGLPVRTDLRAGLASDDLGAQAMALWQQLTAAVANAAGSTNGASTPSA